jgi:cytochrome c556
MKAFACLSVAFAFAATIVVTAAVGAEEKTPTIKEVMTKLYKGPNANMAKLKNELNANPPAWKQVKDRTKDFVTLAEGLAKNEPRKGDKDSFKKLADTHLANAKSLNDAAKKEDQKATQEVLKKIGGSCMACHQAHRGR